MEVLSVLRRAMRQRRLTDSRAQAAIQDLRDWPVTRVKHADLLFMAWRHRHRVTAYDAMYVALAKTLDTTLLTTDGPLSRVQGLGILIQNIHAS